LRFEIVVQPGISYLELFDIAELQ